MPDVRDGRGLHGEGVGDHRRLLGDMLLCEDAVMGLFWWSM